MKTRVLYALLALASAVHVARAWPSRATVVDDAYISARYAAQLWAGNGLSFNPSGAPIEGYTNLAWTLWLAPWHATNVPIHAVMVYTGLAFGVLTVIGVGLLAESLARTEQARAPLAGGLGALVIALDPHLAVVSTNGLESSMFAAWVVAASWATLSTPSGARPLALLLVATLPFVRPEGAAVAVGLGLAAASLRASRDGWRALPVYDALIAAVVGQLVLTGWRIFTYGRLVPNTFDAKAKQGASELLAGNLKLLAPEWPFWPLALLIALVSPLWAWRDQRRWWLLAIAGGLVLVAFRVPMWMPGGRLLVPALAVGVALASSALTSASAPRVTWSCLMIAGMGLASMTTVEQHTRRYDGNHSALPNNGAQRAAEHLRAHAPTRATLTARDAGVFAYFVGPEVFVHETHNRALTLPHPDRDDADVVGLAPTDPTFVVLTINREAKTGYYYGPDRIIHRRLGVDYDYLGRVEQHYHRYYDIYARTDAKIPPLPAAIVVNQLGPTTNRVRVVPPASSP